MRPLLLLALLFSLLTSGCSTVEGWLGMGEEETMAAGVTDASSSDIAADLTTDTATAAPLPEPVTPDCDIIPTLSSIEEGYLVPSCTFASCHDAELPAAGLDLTIGHAYDSLVEVEAAVEGAPTLVVPGDPDGSYLIQRVEGTADTFMPQGVTEPMDPQCRIATLRAWILAGAPAQ